MLYISVTVQHPVIVEQDTYTINPMYGSGEFEEAATEAARLQAAFDVSGLDASVEVFTSCTLEELADDLAAEYGDGDGDVI